VVLEDTRDKRALRRNLKRPPPNGDLSDHDNAARVCD
jgi:hypothetical protein